VRHPAALSVALGVVAAAGCAGNRPAAEPLRLPVELAGRACGPGDPSLEVVATRPFRCGKGDTCTAVDERLRNPTAVAIWLLLDASDAFSQELDSVSLLRARLADHPPPPVWQLLGETYDDALLLPPGADLLARNLEYHRALQRPRAVFLDRIALADGRDLSTLAPEGLVPASGEIDLSGIGGAITDYDSHDVRRFSPKQRIAIRVRCILDGSEDTTLNL
jgi:hypothetical protein